MPIPSYNEWLRDTNAGTFSRRKASLKALDEAIRLQNKGAIKDALINYLAEGDADYHARNRTGAIDSLSATVCLESSLINDFGVTDFPPDVVEPPNPIPRPPVRVQATDAWGGSGLDHLFTLIPKTNAAPRRRLTPEEYAREANTKRDIRVGSLKNKLNSVNIDLVQLELEVRVNLLRGCHYFTEALRLGIDKFKELHLAEAQDRMFNITILNGLFSVLKVLPFPLSVLGSVGGAVAGLAQVDTTWSGFQVKPPTPDGVIDKMKAAASATYRDLTTINVQTNTLANHAAQITTFISKFDSYADTVIVKLKEERKDIDSDAKREAYAELFKEKIQGMRGINNINETTGHWEQLLAQQLAVIKDKFRPLAEMPPLNVLEAAYWLTVQLIADYAMNGVFKNKQTPIKTMSANDLGKVTFGEPFINFLASDEIGIIKLRPGHNTSEGIYQGGQIPWANRYYDVIALMLFLEWFQREVNPFELLRPGITSQNIRAYVSAYIKNLGDAMKRYASSSSVTAWKSVTSVQDVYAQVSQNLPSRPTSTSSV